MTSKSNHESIRIKPKYLCQHWIDSQEETLEEKRTDGEGIYRPKDFKEFPASYFRMKYISFMTMVSVIGSLVMRDVLTISSLESGALIRTIGASFR